MIKYLRNNLYVYSGYSKIVSLLNAYRFRKVNTLLLFVGYPRSGSSTLGSILDAHKNIVIAHEFNILKYIQKQFKPLQLFYLLAKNSKLAANKGRVSSGYNGIIKGQYNGNTNSCYIIGDKKAGATSRMLENNRELENMLIDFFPKIKLIHIVRNPFDMIATQAYSGNEKQLKVTEGELTKTIEFYALKFQTIDRLIKEAKFDILTIKHENLLANPKSNLAFILNWLDVDAYDGYIESCKAHLYSTPHQSRGKILWNKDQIEMVKSIISNHEFLTGYSFEN